MVREPELTSTFNEAINQLQRIGNALENCGRYATSGNFIAWRWELDKVKRELSYDIGDSKNADWRKELQTIERLLDMAFLSGRKALQYRLLDRKEVLLRGFQELAGKGSAFKEKNDDSEHW